ncbi:hypothetical protein [Sphingobium sp. CCH11-B1]|jgi:hypothetical protein|uniref:hypothetical protein n=1 Tax=Sphingobium sp. CCH11-B1 TaxID=1768781 RepID=UPI0012E38BE1|nr:hypothetical protein [Sphingobium sp. CCH11-B1]MEA3389476.1 hypothetical protein [Pseudomonadota bacterium]
MRRWSSLLLIIPCVQPLVGRAQTLGATPAPATRQLSGVTVEEATALIEKLEDAQRGLRTGQFQSFELLAGSIASNDQTKVSPREAFMSVPFQKIWQVQRATSDKRLRQPYRLTYFPNGLGQPYWEIEVVLGLSGNVERVLMRYETPAPF